MQGDPRVIEILNDVLSAELTAVNQYFVHAKMQGNWGYTKLHDFTRAESIDEMRHAEMLMDRILFLDGIPNVQRLYAVKVGEDVKEQFEVDLELEYAAIKRLNEGVAACVAASDSGSRELLERILVSEEEHTDWLEAQLTAITQIGIENYLAQQLG